MSSDRVRETALGIIAAADDIAMLEQRGMKPADIAQNVAGCSTSCELALWRRLSTSRGRYSRSRSRC
jgi:hypothetical protein